MDHRLALNTTENFKPKPIVVAVTNSMAQKHVVWLGGSTVACSPHFSKAVHLRKEYEEVGPSCCRFNVALQG